MNVNGKTISTPQGHFTAGQICASERVASRDGIPAGGSSTKCPDDAVFPCRRMWLMKFTLFCWLAAVVQMAVLGCMASQRVPVSRDGGGGDGQGIEGAWQGTEVGRRSGRWIMTVDGADVQFNGPKGEWYRGTLSVITTTIPHECRIEIKDCTAPCECAGQAALGIYELVGNALKMAIREPGGPTIPTAFEPDGAVRVFEFTRSAQVSSGPESG